MIESPLTSLYRRLLKPAPWQRWTAEQRALPSFLVIGAMRSGTTSLYSSLCRHPRIHPALKKEIHFFDLYFDRGLSWYRAHFPLKRRLTAQAGLTGEASPYYLSHPLAPARAAEVVPEARLVVLLRDPVARAYSHYWHAVRLGVEPLSFEEALKAEPDRLRGEVEKLRAQPGYHSFPHQHLAYTTRSQYAGEIDRWLACFPREQMLVLESRALREDYAGQMTRLFEFLGLPPAPPGPPPTFNRASYPPMAPGTREHLQALFAPHNERLFNLIGERFVW